MNLYKVMLNHYAPKDNKAGLSHFIVANNDEEVLAILRESSHVYSPFDNGECDEEDDEINVEWTRAILESHDEENTGSERYEDLYYGKTFYSWEKVADNTSATEALRSVGIEVKNKGE